MKKLFLILSIVLLSYDVNAQNQENDWVNNQEKCFQGTLNKAVDKARLEAQKYDKSDQSQAAFVVDFLGIVYYRPPKPVDEDDLVKVFVVAPENLLKTLKVYRSSTGRDPSVIYNIGIDKSTRDKGSDTTFCFKVVVLTDFSPGEGIVSIESSTENPITSNFKFVVNKLFAGAFHFGPIYTHLEDNEFGLTNTAQGNVIYKSNKKSPRVDYMVAYSPFLFGGKRDLQKDKSWFVEPFIGAGLKDIGENGFVGISFGRPELLYFVLGVHIGKVSTLHVSDEVGLGKPFNGSADMIPMESKVKAGIFYGVTLDLRTAKQLFTSLFNSQ